MSRANQPPMGVPLQGGGHQHATLDPDQQRLTWGILGGLVLLLTLAYADMLALTATYWRHDGLYSHGYIVPFMAIGLMYFRWQPFKTVAPIERWIGLAILGVSLGVRLIAATYDMAPLDRLTFIGALIGVFTVVGGWHLIRWAGLPLLFLVFMYPFPSRLEPIILGNLQRVATIASTFVLQTMGIAAFREGSIINISVENVVDNVNQVQNMTLGVVDACSGLRMLTIFIALAVGLVMLIDRPWWDKFIILLSAIPIAVAVNVVRITLTALLYKWAGQSEFLKHVAHDWAGYFMMPLALGILALELELLRRITVPETGIGGAGAPMPTRTARTQPQQRRPHGAS